MNVNLKRYDSKTWSYVETGEVVDLHALSHSLSAEQLASLLSDWANAGGKGQKEGREVGRALSREHRHLQHLVVQMCIGILHQMGLQKWTDERNEFAIKTCQKISRFLVDKCDYYFREEE